MALETAAAAAPSVFTTLGINWTLLVAQLVNFAVVLFVLARWVWKPVIRTLDDRSSRIAKSLEEAKRIDHEVAQLEVTRIKIMKSAEEKANEVVAEAMKSAEQQRTELLAKTRRDVEQLVNVGREALGREKTQALAEAKAELAELVVAAASRVIGESMDDKKHRAMVDRTVREMVGK